MIYKSLKLCAEAGRRKKRDKTGKCKFCKKHNLVEKKKKKIENHWWIIKVNFSIL